MAVILNDLYQNVKWLNYQSNDEYLFMIINSTRNGNRIHKYFIKCIKHSSFKCVAMETDPLAVKIQNMQFS